MHEILKSYWLANLGFDFKTFFLKYVIFGQKINFLIEKKSKWVQISLFVFLSVKIVELNEYLLSMKFDSCYVDNLLQPKVGESIAVHS